MIPYEKPGMRVSRAGSAASPGSFHGRVMRPSPLVSITVGHHPCDARSSPVSSNCCVSSQPTTFGSPLNQRVSLPSSANCRWCVP